MQEGLTVADLLVMLVEPSAVQRKIITQRLEETGVRSVLGEESGGAALTAMGEEVPDLVISAMHMPDMTGSELVQRMRADAALAAVPFMLVSSETDETSLDAVRQAGAIAILPKPFAPRELQRALHAAVDYIVPDTSALADFDPELLRVLVVDDSLTARRHIRRVLSNLGIEHIDEAGNGHEAVEMLAAGLYDLLVTDYNMPEMDGRELVEHVREKSSQSSIPILMVTSESNESRLSAVRQAGTSAICDKPFETASVRALIADLLSA